MSWYTPREIEHLRDIDMRLPGSGRLGRKRGEPSFKQGILRGVRDPDSARARIGSTAAMTMIMATRSMVQSREAEGSSAAMREGDNIVFIGWLCRNLHS